jgi:hypothetical protein
MDSISLDAAKDYGEFKVHPGDHYSVWEQLRRTGLVPAHMEYEEPPRGRVVYNTRPNKFRLFADTCILEDKRLVRRIMAALELPDEADLATDEHYRCGRCLPKDGSGTY